MKGKRIAIRGMAIVKTMTQHIFPGAQMITIPAIGPMIAAVCQEYHLHRHLIGKARQICGMPPEGCNLMP